MGDGPVEPLNQAAPGLNIRRCQECEAPLCARFVQEGLELRRDDGLRLLRPASGSLESLGPGRVAVFLQSLALEAELRPRRPTAGPVVATPDPIPQEAEPRIRPGPLTRVEPPQAIIQRVEPSVRLVGRSGRWHLGGSAGLRWRSPGLFGPHLGLDLGWGPLRLDLRGDLPARGMVNDVQLRVFGWGGGLNAAWERRRARWLWGLEGGLRWDWLRVRLQDAEGLARGDGVLVGLGLGLHAAVLIRRLELGLRVGADAFPGGFQVFVDGQRSALPPLNAWGLTSNLSLRGRP